MKLYAQLLILSFATLLSLFVANDISARTADAVHFGKFYSEPDTGGCSDIAFSYERPEPCLWRIHVENANDVCYMNLRLHLDSGTFTGWSTTAGWTGEQISPTEIELTHSSGIIPFGMSLPIGFSITPGISPTLSILWDNTCAMEGCATDYILEACPIIADACIIGIKYLECNDLPYTNQPALSGWTINLLDAMGNTLDSMVTASDGSYSFCDLAPGNYVVKETNKPGWTANVPATGQSTVVLDPSEQEERNFGNCPACSCDSIYLHLTQVEGVSDTSTYYLSVTNSAPSCFSFINIQIDSGQLLNWNLLLPGWEATLQGPNLLQLTPPGPQLPGGGTIPLSMQVMGTVKHKMSVSTYWGDGFNDVECKRSYAFPSPPERLPNNCCPNCTFPGPELVVNGDFTAGVMGFTWSAADYVNSYVYGPGRLDVANGANLSSHNGNFSCIGKSGSLNDNYLLVDGSLTVGEVWEENVPVTAGTQYSFFTYVNNVMPPGKNAAMPTVQLAIVSIPSGLTVLSAPLTLPESPNSWVKLGMVWQAPTTGMYKLQIFSTGTGWVGNDFAVDCVSFRSCTPLEAKFIFQYINNCGKVQFIDQSTGPDLLNYSWNFGDPGSPSNNSTLQNPIHNFTECRDYEVCLTISKGTCVDSHCQLITVSDNVPLTITCPQNLTVQGFMGPQGICDGVVSNIGATASDNCQLTNVTYSINNNPPVSGDASGTGFMQGPTTVTYTATDWCGNTASCSFIVTIECHDCYCLPPNMPGLDLVTNGGFSAAGPISNPVSTGYTQIFNGVLMGQEIWIGNNPALINAGLLPCTDTSGTGNMLVVNGAVNPGFDVWCQTFPVTSGTGYIFNYYVTSLTGASPAQLQVYINGNSYGSFCQPLPGPGGLCLWKLCCPPVWNSGDNSSVTVCIRDENTTAQGNDFALDDISFKACVSPCIADFNFMDNGCGKYTFTSLGNAGQPFLNTWNFGDGTGNISTGNTVIMHQFTSPGPHTVTLTVTCADGSTISYSVAINVPPFLTVNAGLDQTVCKWQKATLIITASGGVSPYTYSPANPYITPQNQTATIYTVQVTDANGCTATDQVMVNTKICDCDSNQIVQNGDFSQTFTPIIIGVCNDIDLATPWSGIWAQTPTLNTGGVRDINHLNFSSDCPSFMHPTPPGGNYADLECFYSQTDVSYRRGIMNVLSAPITKNSGLYKVSMKIACLRGPFSTTRLRVFGTNVSTGANLADFYGPVGASSPSNLGLFGSGNVRRLGAAILLDGIAGSSNLCDRGYRTISLTVNSATWTNDINRIFLTRGDAADGYAWLAIDDVCIEPIFDEPGCQCGTLEWAEFWQQFSFSSPIACNQGAISVPCPNPNQLYSIHGKFTCAPDQCSDNTNTVSWVLHRPGGLTDVIGSNGWAPYPYFYVQMSPSDFTVPGTYSLTITKHCGPTPCTCTFNFIVPACPCPCATIKEDVASGFSVVGPTSIYDCSRTFKPAALCPNDVVTWTVPGLGNLGTTMGGNPKVINFPHAGAYTVCINVLRTDPITMQPCESEWCQLVLVHCRTISDPEPHFTFCPANVLKNGDFRDSSIVSGFLGEGGSIPDWELALNYGQGAVFADDSTGACDPGQVILQGGKGNFAGIYQVVDITWDQYTIVEYHRNNHKGKRSPPGTAIEFRLQAEPFPDSSPAVVIHREEFDSIAAGWERKTFSPLTMFNPDSAAYYRYLVICLQNNSDSIRSVVGIDNIEICTSSTVDSKQPEQVKHFRIFPNPNPGTFSVELPEPAPPSMKFRIFGITGQLMKEQETQPGIALQKVQTGDLPTGLYFLQVVSDGKVMAIEKFVKQ